MGKKTPRTAKTDDKEELRKELKSFVSGIGLFGGDGGENEHDEFHPDIAARRLGESASRQGSSCTEKQYQPKLTSKKGVRASGPSGDTGDEKAASRSWNHGSGKRPGGTVSNSQESSVWHEAAPEEDSNTNSKEAAPANIVVQKQAIAERALDTHAAKFEKTHSKRNPADAQWLQTARRSGTSRDKVAANAVLVEESALHNLRALDELISVASKRGGAQASAGHAVDTLRELFAGVLLPDRHLVTFDARPVHKVKANREGERQLLFWWFEDCIKRRYATFVTALESLASGTLDWAKEKAMKAAQELLSSKPELEGRLLSLLVNKLGDPSRRVASNAGYLLSCVLTEHPVMSPVVVREIERFLYRPNQKPRALYFAIVTLNQMVLSHHKVHGAPVAAKLIDVYFSLFDLVLNKKVGFSMAEKAALPATKSSKKNPKNRKDGYSNKKARLSKEKITDCKKSPEVDDSDSKILSALITGVRRAHPYVPSSSLDTVFLKHADSLFRTVHQARLTVSIQALMLLLQVLKSQEAVSDRFYTALYAVLLRADLPKSSMLTMFFGLLYQAMSSDSSKTRVAAFMKRTLQFATSAPANVACACLVVVSEVLKVKTGLWMAISEVEDQGPEVLADDVGTELPNAQEPAQNLIAVGNGTGKRIEVIKWPQEDCYDMRKRVPQYARAERACLWELSLLGKHVHPSVAAMANTLLAGTTVAYSGDPLVDLTVISFLGKFVKRKPKTGDNKGKSVMQHISVDALEGLEVSSAAQQPGSVAFASLSEEDVEAGDIFFHRYFTMERVKQRRAEVAHLRALKKRKRAKSDEDDEWVMESDDGTDGEDEFMDGLEAMQDDNLGDPMVGADGNNDNHDDNIYDEIDEEDEGVVIEHDDEFSNDCHESN